MPTHASRSARAGAVRTARVPVPVEPALDGTDFDYADAFEARITGDDDGSAEAWARAGLEGAPAWMRAIILVAHRQVLRFRPDEGPSDGQILGWRITTSDDDVVRLDTDGPLMRASLVARRTEPGVVRVATFLWFQHSVTPLLWAAVGPLHRAFVPRLLRHAASQRLRSTHEPTPRRQPPEGTRR